MHAAQKFVLTGAHVEYDESAHMHAPTAVCGKFDAAPSNWRMHTPVSLLFKLWALTCVYIWEMHYIYERPSPSNFHRARTVTCQLLNGRGDARKKLSAMEPPINYELNFKWARIPSTERAVGRQRFISAPANDIKMFARLRVCAACNLLNWPLYCLINYFDNRAFSEGSQIKESSFWQRVHFRPPPNRIKSDAAAAAQQHSIYFLTVRASPLSIRAVYTLWCIVFCWRVDSLCAGDRRRFFVKIWP